MPGGVLPDVEPRQRQAEGGDAGAGFGQPAVGDQPLPVCVQRSWQSRSGARELLGVEVDIGSGAA